MQLTYKRVPLEFLREIPEGIKFVNKQGHDFLIVDRVLCPNGHDLMATNVRIHGEPSVRIEIDTGASRGLVFVDAFWGGHDKLYNFIPILSESHPHLDVFCPTCKVSLVVDAKCRQQGCSSTKALALALPGGKNRILACAKLGCPGHHIEIGDVPEKVSDEVDGINFFGASADDIFQGI
jgi:hypothetical protein